MVIYAQQVLITFAFYKGNICFMKLLYTIFIIIVLLVTGSAYGQLATYTGSGGTSTAVTGYPNETVSILQNTGFGSNTACGSGGLSGKTVATTWTSYNTTGPHYYIQILPNAGYQLNVTGFTAGMRVSNTGPTKVRYAYSLDGGVTWTDDGIDHVLSNPGCGSSVASSWSGGTLPTGISSTTNGIIVALFPFSPGAAAGTFQTNYINVLGTVTNGCTPPVVTVSPSSPSFCAGSGGVTLTASGAGTTGTYSWTTSTGLSATTGAVVIANPAATTTYTVTGYTSPTCSSSTTVTTTVNPLPVAGAITGPDSVCAGATISLSNTTAAPAGTWTVINSAVATVSGTGAVGGALADTTTIKYSVTTVCGTAIATKHVVVNPLPNAGSVTGPDSVCYGTAVSLTASVAGGTWSSTNTSIASVNSTGLVTGLSAALATTSIVYTSYTYSCGSDIESHAITVKPQPNAGIVNGAVICNTTTTLLASSAPGGTWTSSNTGVASITSGGLVYAVGVGRSVITYTVINSCGTATDTALVSVNPLPGIIAGSGPVCVGLTTVFSDTSTGGSWSTSDASVATIDASGTAYGTGPGTATITYAYNATGCYVTMPLTVNLSLPPSLSISASTPLAVCAGTPVTYTAYPVNGGTSPLFVWSINGVILAGTPTYTYTPSDGDIVRCWFISSLGCAVPDTASAVLTMIVHHIATPALSIATGTGDTVCLGNLTTFTPFPIDGGTAPTYQWYVNLAFAGVGNTYSYIPAHGDVVTAIMASNEYCRTSDYATATRTLTVSPLVLPLVSTSINPGLTSCELYPVTYTASQINGGTMPTYQWSVNGVNTTTGNVFSYVPSNGDVVQVALTSNFPCVSTPTVTDISTMTVLPLSQPIGVISAMPGYIINEGAYDTFSVTILSGGGMSPTYQWFKNNIPMPGATNSVYITNNLYTGDSVNCMVTNTDQCSGVSVFNSVKVTVAGNVGVNTIGSNEDIMLLPNPNNGTFTIKGSLATSDGSLTVEITDMAGRSVYHDLTELSNGAINKQVSTEGLPAGMYLLQLRNSAISKTLHFVIE